MNGDWFWWGNVGHTPEDFHRLYRETVRYLSEEGQAHNILYCYSPDRCYSSEEYLTYYPGDDWVDILGLDLYDFNNGWYELQADTALTVLTDLALARNKVCAFTETGLENLIYPDWWTKRLLPVIQDKSIAYVLVWRNAHTRHFFGPYSGHPSAADFRLFASSAEILLQSDLPK
jgi:mannan endo-1,4-beta-mannosidase